MIHSSDVFEAIAISVLCWLLFSVYRYKLRFARTLQRELDAAREEVGAKDSELLVDAIIRLRDSTDHWWKLCAPTGLDEGRRLVRERDERDTLIRTLVAATIFETTVEAVSRALDERPTAATRGQDTK